MWRAITFLFFIGACTALALGAPPASQPVDAAYLAFRTQLGVARLEVLRAAAADVPSPPQQRADLDRAFDQTRQRMNDVLMQERERPSSQQQRQQIVMDVARAFSDATIAIRSAPGMNEALGKRMAVVQFEIQLIQEGALLGNLATLELTDDQTSKAQEILGAAAAEPRDAQDDLTAGVPAEEKRIAATLEVRNRVRALLTDAQRQRWEQVALDLLAEQRKRDGVATPGNRGRFESVRPPATKPASR